MSPDEHGDTYGAVVWQSAIEYRSAWVACQRVGKWWIPLVRGYMMDGSASDAEDVPPGWRLPQRFAAALDAALAVETATPAT